MSKLIGVYDVSPQMMWTGNFFKAQGVDIQKIILMQDNKSSILLAENSQAKTHQAYWNSLFLHQG